MGKHANMDCSKLASQQDVPETLGNTPRKEKPATEHDETDEREVRPPTISNPACGVAVGNVSCFVATLA